MLIKFIGHAACIIQVEGISILLDPWLIGSAFNDSWLPYPQPVLNQDDLAEVTHLWISHEHPDHFSIPTLKSLSSSHRKNIIVLFQEHISKTVRDYFLNLNFAGVQELAHAKWVCLAGQVSIYCRQIGNSDSLLAVKDGHNTILNLNDCECPRSTLRSLSADVGPVDVLLNQFSPAGWVGNPDDPEGKELQAKNKLKLFAEMVHALTPKKVVPFASFARFCQPDNCHVNYNANSTQDVVDLLGEEKVVVLYPGDVWNIDQAHCSVNALRRYARDREQIGFQPLLEPEPKTMVEILAVANSLVQQLQQNYHRLFLSWVPPIRFYVYDLNRYFLIDLKRGVSELSDGVGDWDVKLGSQAAWFTFSARYGISTLGSSSLHQIGPNPKPFRRLKKLASAYSSGFTSKSNSSGLWQFFPSWLVIRHLAKRPGDILSQFVARFN